MFAKNILIATVALMAGSTTATPAHLAERQVDCMTDGCPEGQTCVNQCGLISACLTPFPFRCMDSTEKRDVDAANLERRQGDCMDTGCPEGESCVNVCGAGLCATPFPLQCRPDAAKRDEKALQVERRQSDCLESGCPEGESCVNVCGAVGLCATPFPLQCRPDAAKRAVTETKTEEVEKRQADCLSEGCPEGQTCVNVCGTAGACLTPFPFQCREV